MQDVFHRRFYINARWTQKLAGEYCQTETSFQTEGEAIKVIGNFPWSRSFRCHFMVNRPLLSLSLYLFQNARNVFKQQLMDRLLTETLFGSVDRCTNSIIVLLLFIICNFLPCIPIKPINRRPIAERGRFPSQVFCRAEMQWKCILKNDETRKKNYCFWRLWKC